jgi:hypothetical protein
MIVASHKIRDYASVREGSDAVTSALNHNQNGDTRLGVLRIIDVVTGTGMASGKPFPLRVALGRYVPVLLDRVMHNHDGFFIAMLLKISNRNARMSWKICTCGRAFRFQRISTILQLIVPRSCSRDHSRFYILYLIPLFSGNLPSPLYFSSFQYRLPKYRQCD